MTLFRSGLSESQRLGFSKSRDKMISDDGSGTKIRVRYWITSVKQPRDFSQGRRSCGQPTSSMHCEPLTIERLIVSGNGCETSMLRPAETALTTAPGDTVSVRLGRKSVG